MKILAAFDGTPFGESTLPLLQRVAALPGAEVVLLRIKPEPSGRRMRAPRKTYSNVGQPGDTPLVIEMPQADYAETAEQAIDRALNEMQNYLHGLAKQLPDSAKVQIEAHIHEDPAQAIIDEAREEAADVIVMATHSRRGLRRALFGSTTEAVIKSGIAPVLVVHPKD
jgi:nucleotide-binding universal stress UspA family protein